MLDAVRSVCGTWTRRWILLFVLVACFLGAGSVGAEEPLAVDDIMWQDPPYTAPDFGYEYPLNIDRLWKKALEYPDSELRRTAADTIVIAQRRGVPGLTELTSNLVEILKSENQESSVRRAAAHALVVMDVSTQAQLLAQVAETDGLDVARFVEPALAKWKYVPIQKTWLERLKEPAIRPLWLMLAIRCVADTQAQAAREPLLKIAHDRRTAPTVRLAAAQSLAAIFANGLVADAKQRLAADSMPSTTDRLIGVTLISRHSDAEAITVLKELAVDAEPSVAAMALGRLLAIDPALVFDLAPQAIKSADVNVRRAGAEALIVKADQESIRQMTLLLSDPNPTLRGRVANAFASLAGKAELRDTVTEETERTLAGENWRGLEKSVLLAVRLERKNTANRMIELLSHSRPEVAVTAAWALRRFQLPETLAKMLVHAQLQYDRIVKMEIQSHESFLIDGQHSQLFQAFGQLRYKEAEPLMRKFVPKNFAFGMESRAAAIWSLGYLYEDKAPEDLISQFVDRLSDVASMMPEVTPVRAACGAGLGRMNAKSALAVLNNFAASDGVLSLVGQNCWWSLEKMTDQKRPPMSKVLQHITGWFLMPLDDDVKAK